jgi:hypothetical protein
VSKPDQPAELPIAEVLEQWNTDAGQAVLKALAAFPEARDAIVGALDRLFEAQP